MRALFRISLLLALLLLLVILHSFYLFAGAQNPEQVATHFAYVFYATGDIYACSALVNIHRLRHLFHTKYPVYLLASSAVSDTYKEWSREQYDVTIIEHEPPPLAGQSSPYYHDVLLKLVSFNLLEWAPQLRRILVLDSDQIILKSLDDVFTQVPLNVEVAAAHAYWFSGDPGATTAMIMVSLSAPLWARMDSSLKNITEDVYDMDLINSMFRGEMALLPGNYVTLNSHWETKELPSWTQYRPVLPVQLPWNKTVSSTVQGSPPALLHHSKRKEAQNQTAATFPFSSAPNTLLPQSIPIAFTTYDPATIDPLTSIFHEDVYVLHFTALGKPWTHTIQAVNTLRPQAHPLFAQQFLLWRMAARQICPVVDMHGAGGNTVGGKTGWPGLGLQDGELPSDRFLDDV
ncbi:uncharacterized protein A1O9_10050 [Exophiala aquamarina CBS 119918]|uniref:Glycosyl transferase family 8 n=1 Tax=Exophiala aquamarina CBS 119918 TaxID=1182545 RepID=A0A072PDK4_9EURO|nr:uncharacterized protein A1O9_10050 [Exophiala aquamarina CBS 119918]KEF53650.1 hypothetical protein A1O9_10050 [Exophiala aquamarina CBS 119918]